jgi:hypothetical protein
MAIETDRAGGYTVEAMATSSGFAVGDGVGGRIMAAFGKSISAILGLGMLAGTAALLVWRPKPATRPVDPRPSVEAPFGMPGLEGAPPEVLAFLGRVLQKLPAGGAGVTGFQFDHWDRPGGAVPELLGFKAVPGLDPEALIESVLDVDGYERNIAYVEVSRSVADPAYTSPGRVRLYQRVSVPGVATVQHELALLDAGSIKGYRVACWYLLSAETDALDPKAAARSATNFGAWLAAPGVVGYALSSRPRRGDVNALQWFALTTGADALARKIVEDNIDGMAAWARLRALDRPPRE